MAADVLVGSGDIDCLELTHVPWAEGITARELIACCSPDEAVARGRG